MGGWTRREWFAGLAAALGVIAGCGGGSAPDAVDAAGGADAPPSPDAPPPPDAAPVDGSTIDAETIDASVPDATPAPDAHVYTADELLAPIDTFVVLCMENRSFDHFVGARRLVEGLAGDGLSGLESNPDGAGGTVAVHPLADFTPADPPHDWDSAHAQWNAGANDGFVTTHGGADAGDVMGYYLRDQLPITFALADASALCDRWYASVMGPTWPNRFYLHGATSNGQKSNLPVFGFSSVFDRLSDAGVSHKNYYHDVAWASGGYFKLSGFATIEQFFDDAAAGTLPQFALIDPHFFGSGANDDHPDHDVRLGQALIASVYQALAASPQWGNCLLVVTYDEHGGFFDHVSPPTTVDDDSEFQQLGFRVPSIVAGPFARQGQIVSTTFEHASIIATLTRRYGLAPLNARATAAADLSSCIDPAYLGAPQPPVTLPPVPMFLSILDRPMQGGEHPELARMADLGLIPRHLDRRAEGRAIAERVLRRGAALGAVTLR